MDIIKKKWEFLSNDLAFPSQCFESCSEVLASKSWYVSSFLIDPSKNGNKNVFETWKVNSNMHMEN